jgi:GNAT superfamily N-acetyltransferase
MDPVALLASYARERFGCETENDPGKGFATWKMLDPTSVYLVDIYVGPDFRRSGVAAELANRVAALALKAGAKRMIGSVETKSATATEAMKAILAYGFKITHVEGSMIYLAKELG